MAKMANFFMANFAFLLTIFAIFRHEKLIFKGKYWQNLNIKSLKLYQWALKMDLDMFQLICSQLGQFYEN